MSCEECEEADNIGTLYPYRWKNANILVIACESHVMEIFKALTWAQDHP